MNPNRENRRNEPDENEKYEPKEYSRPRSRALSCKEACGMSGCNNSYCSNFSGYRMSSRKK